MPRLWPYGMDRMTADKVSGQDALKFACLHMSMHHPTGKPGESKARDRRIRNGLQVIHLEAGVNGYLRRRAIRFQPPRGVEPRPPVNDSHVLGEVVDAQWAATPVQIGRCSPDGHSLLTQRPRYKIWAVGQEPHPHGQIEALIHQINHAIAE